MTFTNDGLNELLEGLKANFTSNSGTLVAKTAADGTFIAGVNVEFGTITDGVMDIDTTTPVELEIDTVPSDVQALSLYTGVVENGTDMANETELVTVTFTPGTYNFTVAGTLTVNSFEISVAE